jgi:hypothetical protein
MTPEDLFWKDYPIYQASLERVQELQQAAESWRASGQFLAAGIAMSAIMHAGWGLLDGKTRVESVRLAVKDFKQCVEANPGPSFDALLALKLWSQELTDRKYGEAEDAKALERARQETYMAIAERLLNHYRDASESNGFLFRGIRLTGPITGPWVPEFPKCEVDDSGTNFDTNRRIFCFRIPSAFRLLVRIADYRGAWEISEHRAAAFKTAALRGWRYAVKGFVKPELSHDLFAKAADALEKDTLEAHGHREEGWSAINSTLWAPYFRSRSWLGRAVQNPATVHNCVAAAAKCLQDEPVFSAPGVRRFRLLVRTLAGILQLEGGIAPSEFSAELERYSRWFGASEADPALYEFIRNAQTGFAQLAEDRFRGWTAVGRAMAALDRLPLSLLGKTEAEGIGVALDRQALTLIEGPSRLWIYRTLESIRSEKQLRLILLRLFQNAVPAYAQIRHGPIEYGTDIGVLVTDKAQTVLRMYQAKCGNIETAGWDSKIRPQLEKMFQVPLDSFQLSSPIHHRVGILVWNGHAGPHVDPVMKGWAADQRKAFHRDFEFMNLDGLVNYIHNYWLVTALREALSEAGVPIV